MSGQSSAAVHLLVLYYMILSSPDDLFPCTKAYERIATAIRFVENVVALKKAGSSKPGFAPLEVC